MKSNPAPAIRASNCAISRCATGRPSTGNSGTVIAQKRLRKSFRPDVDAAVADRGERQSVSGRGQLRARSPGDPDFQSGKTSTPTVSLRAPAAPAAAAFASGARVGDCLQLLGPPAQSRHHRSGEFLVPTFWRLTPSLKMSYVCTPSSRSRASRCALSRHVLLPDARAS